MANDITGTVWELDTASASAIWVDGLWIKEIRWEGYTQAADDVLLTDNNDRVVLSAAGLASLEPIATQYAAPQRCYGLKMPTLDSGTVFVSIA